MESFGRFAAKMVAVYTSQSRFLNFPMLCVIVWTKIGQTFQVSTSLQRNGICTLVFVSLALFLQFLGEVTTTLEQRLRKTYWQEKLQCSIQPFQFMLISERKHKRIQFQKLEISLDQRNRGLFSSLMFLHKCNYHRMRNEFPLAMFMIYYTQ